MLWLADILRVISALITVYIMLIFIRIMLSWFNGLRLGKAMNYLYMITDPFLALFRPLTFLRKGNMDFTPLAASLVLSLASSLCDMLAGTLSMGVPFSLSMVIMVILKLLWDGIFWIALFFLAFCLIRSVSLFISRNPMSGNWQLMDYFIGPFVHTIEKGLTKLVRRSLSYLQLLLVAVGLIAVFMLLGSFIINQVIYMLAAFKI
jgi:YggT family protein